jgi:L-threonylcarbamoyladenylate synthase
MARLITKEYIEKNPDVLIDLKKSIFVYPTDTIYGIGCDSTNKALVQKIREIKQRSKDPFSIAIPHKDLIVQHCVLSAKAQSWLDDLPGPFTLILPVSSSFVADNVSPDGVSIGVRMFSTWFQNIIAKLDVPIVTTSVNFRGKPFMTSIKNIDKDIKSQVDFIIDDGELNGRPSKIINLLDDVQELR